MYHNSGGNGAFGPNKPPLEKIDFFLKTKLFFIM